jgi:ClpA/ClpB-like protein
VRVPVVVAVGRSGLAPATADSILGLHLDWPAPVAEVAPHFVAHSSTNFAPAHRLDSPVIEPEHLLLALFRNPGVLALPLLEVLGVDDQEALRAQVLAAALAKSPPETWASSRVAGRLRAPHIP